MNILGITDARPFGSAKASVLGVSRYGTVAAAPPVGSIDVTEAPYNADNTGSTDATAAINAALDAAGALASAGNRQTVYLPAGTYKVIPTGLIHMRIHTKAAGSWSLTSDDPSNQKVGDWHIYDVAPTSGDGVDGDRWINRNENKVYLKTAGTWGLDSILFDGSGAGWYAGYLEPDNADGVDGDVYIQYWLTTKAPFMVRQNRNHVTLKGAGIAATKLLYRCWGDIDPNDYTLDGSGNVLTSQIPPDRVYVEGARTSRTPLFEWDSDGTHATIPLNGFWLEDFEMDGNTVVDDYAHLWYTYNQQIDQWDQNHKGCVFTYGADGNVLDVQIKRVHAHNIRGEIFYAGGGMNKEILLEDCEIAYSKASATSISGSTTARRCNVHHIANGFENYTFDQYSHFTIVEDCIVDMSGSGGNGIVYLGERGANTYFHVFRNTITGKSQGKGIFIDSFGDNIRIEDNNFVDVEQGISFQDTGAYSGITRGFNNVNIEGNTFTCWSVDAVAIYWQLTTHLITNCTVVNNTFFKGTTNAKFQGVWNYNFSGDPANFDVVFTNNDTDTFYFSAFSGIYPDLGPTNTTTGARPLELTSLAYNLYPQGTYYFLQNNTAGTPVLNMVPGVDKFNVFTFDIWIESWQNDCRATIPAAVWNSLGADILMRDVVKHSGSVYRFTFNNVTNLWDITTVP